MKKVINAVKRLWDKYGLQFIRFGCVGVVNTLVDLAVYWLANKLLGERILLREHNYLIAQFLGFVAGTLNAYFMNGAFVFKKADNTRNRGERQLIRTFVGYGFTFALSELCLWLLKDKAHMDDLAKLPPLCVTIPGGKLIKIELDFSKLLLLCVTIPLNFIINRFWTFRNKTDAEGK